MGSDSLFLPREVAKSFLDFGIRKRFGEQWVAEKCAEISLASKCLEGGVLHDNGAGDGLAGGRVDFRDAFW